MNKQFCIYSKALLFITTNLYAFARDKFKDFSITKYLTFTALLIAAGLAGRITIPGTQVGITMQTFVLMLIALNLTLNEGLGVIITYITLGAAGMPIFSGGMSTLALIDPSAGFIWGFIPAFIVSHYGLKFINSCLESSTSSSSFSHLSHLSRFFHLSHNRTSSHQPSDYQGSHHRSVFSRLAFYRDTLYRAAGSFIALTVGCMVVLYIIGVSIQSILVNASFSSLMLASMGFVGFDCVKALVAVLATSGVRKLVSHDQNRK